MLKLFLLFFGAIILTGNVYGQNYGHWSQADSLNIPRSNHASVLMADGNIILGERVTTLMDEIKKPGYYEIKFNGSCLGSVIYSTKIFTKNKVLTRRCVLLK